MFILRSWKSKRKNEQDTHRLYSEPKTTTTPHNSFPHTKDVEKELERPERIYIIEKVDAPTPWVSPIVVVLKKAGEVRICVALREANKAVKREKHQIVTTDELISDFNDAIQSLANWISPLHTTSPNWRQKVVTSPHLAPCTLA